MAPSPSTRLTNSLSQTITRPGTRVGPHFGDKSQARTCSWVLDFLPFSLKHLGLGAGRDLSYFILFFLHDSKERKGLGGRKQARAEVVRRRERNQLQHGCPALCYVDREVVAGRVTALVGAAVRIPCLWRVETTSGTSYIWAQGSFLNSLWGDRPPSSRLLYM